MHSTGSLVEDKSDLRSVVNRIAGLLAHGGGGTLTAGDVAALRRMDPRKPAAAFFKLASVTLESRPESGSGGADERDARWSAIIVGLACLGDLHRPGASLARALIDAGFSELRFARLLRADGDRLLDDIPMLGRYLAAKAAPADWTQAAWLMLSAGRTDEETARRSLARDYYSALARKTNT